MKKQYYVRYYQTDDNHQTFEQFLQAIASVGLRLHSSFQREIERREYSFFEYTTIWEIDTRADFELLEDKIDGALNSKRFKNSG